ncbi:MAG TPA: PAS domain-containing protein, partial [Adhaeribacter sp.]|nr:PAS domain-containing protein [Adhaeribacter sp.]
MKNQDVLIPLNDAINVLPDAAIVVNQNVKIIAVNMQIYNMFGYQPNDLMHQDLDILIPERFRKNHNKYFKNYFTSPVKRHMKSGN